MQRVTAGAAVATALVAALFPAVAASAPKSPYTASCATGGVTRADWQHAKLVQIEFVRLGLANSILPYFAVADHVTRSSLAATRIKDLFLSQTLVWRSDRPQNALVAEVAEAIRTIMRRRIPPQRGGRRGAGR